MGAIQLSFEAQVWERTSKCYGSDITETGFEETRYAGRA